MAIRLIIVETFNSKPQMSTSWWCQKKQRTCTKLHGNLSNSCWDICIWIKAVHRQTDFAIPRIMPLAWLRHTHAERNNTLQFLKWPIFDSSKKINLSAHVHVVLESLTHISKNEFQPSNDAELSPLIIVSSLSLFSDKEGNEKNGKWSSVCRGNSVGGGEPQDARFICWGFG